VRKVWGKIEQRWRQYLLKENPIPFSPLLYAVFFNPEHLPTKQERAAHGENSL